MGTLDRNHVGGGGGGGGGRRRYSVHAMRMRYGGGVRVRRAVVITVIL